MENVNEKNNINDTEKDIEKITCKVLDVREYVGNGVINLALVCEKIGETKDRMIIRGYNTPDNAKVFKILELAVPNDIILLMAKRTNDGDDECEFLKIVSVDLF